MSCLQLKSWCRAFVYNAGGRGGALDHTVAEGRSGALNVEEIEKRSERSANTNEQPTVSFIKN